MNRPRLALLNAAYEAENTRRNFRRELDADLAEFDATDGELPPDFDYDGVVVTGSAASVYEDEPWIEALVEWVREAYDRDLPILGVCFGHQVLAAALGGTVEAMGAYEIGYREVRRTGDSLLLDGLDDEFTVFTTHRDAVVELPPEAAVTAENEYGIHGFRHGHAFAVQFHPEYDVETAERLARAKDLDDETLQRVLDGITEENYAAACEAKRLFDNFLGYVREHRQPATAD